VWMCVHTCAVLDKCREEEIFQDLYQDEVFKWKCETIKNIIRNDKNNQHDRDERKKQFDIWIRIIYVYWGF